MKVLVTGANGYIGKHVVNELLNREYEVFACDLHMTGVDERVTAIEANLFDDLTDIYNRLGSPDVCIHMAWRDGFVHNSANHIGDLSGHFRFLSAMIAGGLKHLAVMGTMHEVGYWEGKVNENTPCNPLSMYGIAKDALRRSILLLCEQNKCVLQWLRAYYILGDDIRNHSVFTKILEAAKAGQDTFPFTTGRTMYDFITVDELAKMVSMASTQEKIVGIINCCSGTPVSLADRVEQYIKEHHLRIKLDYGKYPDRSYDSPIIYGDATKINEILKNG